MTSRAAVLELAVLGCLHEGPMHGYQLRKRLDLSLGSFRVLSYGTLYPCLKRLLARDWIAQSEEPGLSASVLTGRRARITYELTAAGKEHFCALLSEAGPPAWEDSHFDVHFAFFSRTDPATRIRILEGRRTRLQERTEMVRQSLARTRERLDNYTLELQRHGLDSVEREVRWLDELIDSERSRHRPRPEEPSTTSPRADPPGAGTHE